MHEFLSPAHLREAMADIARGESVTRGKHSLFWGSADLSHVFTQVLRECGYKPMLVRDADIQPGERVPAFCIERGTAYFGWIFWEKFSPLKLRKLFGSAVRNSKGDWEIQIPPTRGILLYVNMALRCEMDIDRPSSV